MSNNPIVNSGAILLVLILNCSSPTQAESQNATLPISSSPQLLAKVVTSPTTNALAVLPEVAHAGLIGKFSEKDLIFVLTSKLQPKQESADLELSLIQMMPAWRPIPATAGLDVRILSKPPSGLSAQFSVQFEVVCGEKTFGPYLANVKARLFREVWIAARPLRRGAPIEESDLQPDKRDVIGLSREPLWSRAINGQPVRLSDLRVAEIIPTGGIILDRHVQMRPIVFRGRQVQASIEDGAMSVSVTVELLEDGAPGQFVRAKNMRTKKEFRGKVINENKIQVLFQGVN